MGFVSVEGEQVRMKNYPLDLVHALLIFSPLLGKFYKKSYVWWVIEINHVIFHTREVRVIHVT